MSMPGNSDELGFAGVNKWFCVCPSQNDNITLLEIDGTVRIDTAAHDQGVAQQTDEDGRFEIGSIHHGDVAGRVVEVLESGRKGGEERRQIVVVQQSLVAGCIGELHLGETSTEGVGREVMECMAVYLGQTSAQVAAHQILEALELSLDDDEGEVGLGIHVARHLLDTLDLALDIIIDALKQAIRGPAMPVDALVSKVYEAIDG